MKKQIIIALATLTALPAVSQEKWDLRKCIDYAIEHNLSIKQQEAARDQNAVDLNTAKYSRLCLFPIGFPLCCMKRPISRLPLIMNEFFSW